MIGIVIVCHGSLAQSLIETAESVVGKLQSCLPVSINPHDGGEEIRQAIEEAIRRIDDGDGALLLTDMFGGTPANLSLTFLEEGSLEVLTGVNLPMLIKAFNCRKSGLGLTETAVALAEAGRRNIARAADLMAADEKSD